MQRHNAKLTVPHALLEEKHMVAQSQLIGLVRVAQYKYDSHSFPTLLPKERVKVLSPLLWGYGVYTSLLNGHASGLILPNPP